MNEIDDRDVVGAADAVQATDLLFEYDRVVGQVEVNDEIAELEVTAFAARAGRDQYRAGRHTEFGELDVTLRRAHLFVEREEAQRGELAEACLQRIAALGVVNEDQRAHRPCSCQPASRSAIQRTRGSSS